MTIATRLFCVPALALSASLLGEPPRSQLCPAETVALRAASDPALEALRAGVQPATALRADERAQLQAAAERSAGVDALRAGELHLSDRDLKLILIVAVVTALIVIIL